MAQIQIKRVYETKDPGRGRCFLVERLWPRGIKKEALGIEAWLKDAAPSPELRTWYAHDLSRWEEFQQRYLVELENHPQSWQPLIEAARHGAVTLLYSARDTSHNSALILQNFIEAKLADHP